MDHNRPKAEADMARRVVLRIVAIACALVLYSTTVVAAQDNTETTDHTVSIRARGTTGEEILQVRRGNEVAGEVELDTEWAVIELPIPAATSFDELSVGFVNNRHEPVDRNVFIDWVELGAERREGESSSVWSTGKWTSSTGCTAGPAETETIHCAGFLHFGGKPAGSTITAHAVGATGTENLELLIDDVSVATQRVPATGNVWSSRTATAPIDFNLPMQVDHGRIRIAFTNDDDHNGVDRNVRINLIEVDGASYETSDPGIESIGTWSNGAQCEQGFFENATLACDGWFQLPSNDFVDQPPPVTPGPPAPEPPSLIPDPPVRVDAPELSVEVVADDLTNPWGMAFLPTGELMFTERLGRFSLLSDSGVTRVDADFTNLGSGTSGLLGLAIDPEFATNRRFYTCQGQANPPRQQVLAWQMSADYSQATKSQTFVDVERTGGHSGCQLGIDDAGYLIATFGDDFLASTPQDPDSLHGKVLRIDRFDGTGHPDNLTVGPNRDDRIFTLGHRNPQGLAFHPDTNEPWVSEHGPDRDDEINALVVGSNYGWDPLGPAGPSVYDELGRTMTDPSIADAVGARWSSGSSTIAPGDIAFLDGAQWGAFDRAIAMTTLKDQRLHLFRTNEDGVVVEQAIPAELDRSEFGRLRSAITGPDGALYLGTSNSGFGNEDRRVDAILRVVPASETPNPAPEPPTTTPPPSTDASTISVVSRGSTGTEALRLEIDGVEVLRWTPSTNDSTTTYTHDSAVTGSQVRVRFTNDGNDSGRDRNVWIDSVSIDGELFETEHPTVRSKGAWANGARCREGTFNTEFLACNGWFQYADDGGVTQVQPEPEPQPVPGPGPTPGAQPPSTSQELAVRALGTTGEERIELRLGDDVLATFELGTTMSTYRHDHSSSVRGQIRIAFVNDRRSPDGTDRNVRVDYLDVGTDRYQAEAPTVFSTGTYRAATGCQPGNKQSEWLHCEGYLQFEIP